MHAFITLTDWVVLEVAKNSEKYIHVCGFSKRDKKFKISSRIETFQFHESGFSIVETIGGSNYVLSPNPSSLKNQKVLRFVNEYASVKNTASIQDFTDDYIALIGVYPQ